MTAGQPWVHPAGPVTYHATVELRCRNVDMGGCMVGFIEQKWVSDDSKLFEWRRVPLVPTDSPMSGSV